MNNATQAHYEKVWTHHARVLSKKLNLAWWIELLNLPFTIMAILIATTVLLARYFEVLPAYSIIISSIIFVTIIISFICWKFSQKKFESIDESMVRIEEKLKLKNALSAAKVGIIPWPEAPTELHTGINWHWPRTLLPSLCSLITIIFAFFIPIGSHAEVINNHPSPDNRDRLEQSLAELKDEEIVQEDYIEEMEEKINELASKELQRNMQNAERTLQNLQKHGEKMNQQTKENLLDGFGKAVENLDTGSMKPNKELLDQLKQLDPEQLNQLNEEQLNQLRQNMRKMAEKLKQQTEQGNPDGGDGQDGEAQGQNDGNGEGQDDENGEAPQKCLEKNLTTST